MSHRPAHPWRFLPIILAYAAAPSAAQEREFGFRFERAWASGASDPAGAVASATECVALAAWQGELWAALSVRNGEGAALAQGASQLRRANVLRRGLVPRLVRRHQAETLEMRSPKI